MTHFFLNRAAQKAGFALEVKVSGNMWGEVRLAGITLTPLAVDHPNLESLRCASVEVEYSLRRLLWSGWGESIRRYQIRSLELHLHSLRSHASTARSPGLLQTLEKILALPALYADTVQLEDISVRIADGSPFRHLNKFYFSALEDRSGKAGFESIEFRPVSSGDPVQLKNVSAKTEYSNRKLLLTDLPLTPELRLARFTFDASERVHGRSRIEGVFTAGSGHLRAALFSQQSGFAHGEGHSTRPLWRFEMDGQSFPLQSVLAGLGLATAFAPDIEWVESHAEGPPREPLAWKGQADIRAQHALSGGRLVHTEVHTALHAGTVSLQNTRAAGPQCQAEFTGQIRLPTAWNRIAEWNGSLQWKAHSLNVGEWFASDPSLSAGACQLQGDLLVRSGSVRATVHAGAANLRLPAARLNAGHFSLEATLPLNAVKDATSAKKALSASMSVHVEEGRFSREQVAIPFTRADLACLFKEGQLQIQNAHLESGPNHLLFRGVWEPSLTPEETARIREAHWEISCPSIEKCGIEFRGHTLGGSFQSQGEAEWHPGYLGGTGSLEGTRLRWGDWEVPSLHGKMSANGVQARLDSLRIHLKSGGSLALAGEMDLQNGRAYQGEAQIQIPKLSALTPLFHQLGLENSPLGGIHASWRGGGKDFTREATGQWILSGRDLEWKAIKIKDVQCAGSYGPGRIETSELRLTSGETAIRARMNWIPGSLEVPSIRIEQTGREVLTGKLQLPLALDSTGVHWVDDARIEGELRAHKFNLDTLWKNAGSRPPLGGTVDLLLRLEGTPQTPVLALQTEATGLQTQLLPKFPKFQARLEASHQTGVLQADLTLDSALGGPARLHAVLPLPLKALLQKEAWETAEINARVEWPKIKLGALPALWPALKSVQGEAAIHGHVGGTWNSPRWSGDLKIDAPVLHPANERFPAITDLRVALRGEEGRVRIQTLRADLGGGSLEIRGEARGANLANPHLDLSLLAHQVLVHRSEQLAFRLDGNLRIAGPLQNASVTGKVTPVKSMLRKDIEVLPLSALTETHSSYRRPLGKPWFTFPRGPLANWTFDVGILSRAEDPILIRGNRLRGTALSDLRFQGTGKAPTLAGSFQTNNLLASLPFARIEVTRGRLWYEAANPFAAEVDISAETEVRSHRIRLYLHGPPESPAILVTSDPPLPERDALTLLATGALPGAMGVESSQSMATRAAGLLLQEFSDKFLQNPTSNREGFTALRRFNLEMGAINNRTGTQETRLTYRLMDNVFVIGEVGANGDFASRVRYVLRFR